MAYDRTKALPPKRAGLFEFSCCHKTTTPAPLICPETMHLSHFQFTHFQLTIWWRYSHGIRR